MTTRLNFEQSINVAETSVIFLLSRTARRRIRPYAGSKSGKPSENKIELFYV
jgi:hypothetical protein